MSAFHLGPRTSGNKSLISFRAGHGVAGYVGYIPSSEAIAVPVKHGPSLRNSEVSMQMRSRPLEEKDRAVRPESVYENTISRSPKKSPGSRSATAMVELGSQEPAGATSPHRFIADSLYRQSYGSHPKDALDGGSPTSQRRRPAYLSGTTYGATYENTTEIMHGEGWLDMKRPKDATLFSQPFKEIVCQRSPEPTHYSKDFGTYGDGVAGQLPDSPQGQSLSGTTRHLFEGSPKAFKRVPGYCGFLPTSNDKVSNLQASGEFERKDTKDCRLFTLKQYWLETPGFAGFKPQAATNLVNTNGNGRLGTTSTYMNEYLSKPENVQTINQKRALQEHWGTTQATKTFFSEGQSVEKSENGSKDAESYYKIIRPYEGLPRIMLPSMTAESGYRFNTYSGKV